MADIWPHIGADGDRSADLEAVLGQEGLWSLPAPYGRAGCNLESAQKAAPLANLGGPIGPWSRRAGKRERTGPERRPLRRTATGDGSDTVRDPFGTSVHY